MRIRRTLLALALLAASWAPRTSAQADNYPIAIGSINYFGYGSLDLKKLDGLLPLHIGDPLTHAGFETIRAIVRKAVMTAFGVPATDIAAVCCDQENHLLIYIGLGGSSSRSLSSKPAPTGSEHLDPHALTLYNSLGKALEAAVSQGVAREDRTKGYALSEDVASRALELQAREYALLHEPELERTLRNASVAQQRSQAPIFSAMQTALPPRSKPSPKQPPTVIKRFATTLSAPLASFRPRKTPLRSPSMPDRSSPCSTPANGPTAIKPASCCRC